MCFIVKVNLRRDTRSSEQSPRGIERLREANDSYLQRKVSRIAREDDNDNRVKTRRIIQQTAYDGAALDVPASASFHSARAPAAPLA